jgi:hypothetical protein
MAIGDKVLFRCRPGSYLAAVVADLDGPRAKIRINRANGSRDERWVDRGLLRPMPR